MKATTLLHQDHERVNDLFRQFESSQASRKQLFDEIKNELQVHAEIEEEIFYPAVRQARSANSEDLVIEAMQEHKGVDLMLDELSTMNPDDELYAVKMGELKNAVVHHVEEEESKVFQQAIVSFTDEALEQLGQELQERKESLKSENLDELR